jgi:hypothetical protein
MIIEFMATFASHSRPQLMTDGNNPCGNNPRQASNGTPVPVMCDNYSLRDAALDMESGHHFRVKQGGTGLL